MSTFYYTTEQFLDIEIHTAWDFFSSAKNLALITPPELDFKILTELNGEEIYEGMLINYTVKPLLGIPLRWETEICKVQKPLFFTDRQLKGPYKLWEHTHSYIPMNDGVMMKDEVKYQLPFGFLGDIAHAVIVRRKVENIFSFRREVLKSIFQKNEKVPSNR
jgi:ligand-binding SRPBCC domain-containing protein